MAETAATAGVGVADNAATAFGATLAGISRLVVSGTFAAGVAAWGLEAAAVVSAEGLTACAAATGFAAVVTGAI
jgi:hypothetical protein